MIDAIVYKPGLVFIIMDLTLKFVLSGCDPVFLKFMEKNPGSGPVNRIFYFDPVLAGPVRFENLTQKHAHPFSVVDIFDSKVYLKFHSNNHYFYTCYQYAHLWNMKNDLDRKD